jgi:hypothetical protein
VINTFIRAGSEPSSIPKDHLIFCKIFMALQFIYTGQYASKDVHMKIIDSVFGVVIGCEPNDPELEQKKTAFTAEYRAAMKTSLANLAKFMISKGQELLAKDPNSSLDSPGLLFVHTMCWNILAGSQT